MEFLEKRDRKLKVELGKIEKFAKYLSQAKNMPPEKEKHKKRSYRADPGLQRFARTMRNG
jgi:hypothetical protein